MNTILEARLSQRLAGVRQADRWRRLRTLESPQRPEQIVDGRPMLAFCSNDYLGLAADARVVAAARKGLDDFGMGTGAAHLVNGHTRAHAELEEALAAFTRRPRALLFSTGYMANLGILQTLASRHDQVFADRLNHASLIDAARLTGCDVRRYHHADPDDLDRHLAGSIVGPARLIVTDGVFSMDGDLAPLPGLAQAARRHGAWLVVDDAHGFGVLGARGDGSCGHFGLDRQEVPVLMGTLGKAFGCAGAFVAGSEDLIESLLQFARSYVYTTAMPAALAAAARVSLEIAERESWRRDHLCALGTRLRSGLRQLGLTAENSPTPIVPVVLGSARAAAGAAAALHQRGFLVPAIRPPTVPEGTARLRITLSASHTEGQITRLLEALGDVLCILDPEDIPRLAAP